MVRSLTAFSWKNGNIPPAKIHSRIKLEILRSYLLSYFATVANNPRIDAINIHLVDAFSGGGIFKDSTSGLAVPGSPLVLLQAVQDAEQAIAAHKTKPFKINAKFHFADKCPFAVSRLESTLASSGFDSLVSQGKLSIEQCAFEEYLPTLLSRIPPNPRTKAIFFLDQTGWNHATLSHCNMILNHLPKAEIIWNISVESLAMFASEQENFRTAIQRFGVNLEDAFTDLPNHAHFSNWRKALVSTFLREIRHTCVAQYVSPFIVQHDGWGYWLLHLSNHPEANNVMKATHWQHQNSSLHEGFPGLKMLEFNRDNWGQASIWRFNEDADEATHEALVNELVPRIRTLGLAPTVDQLIKSIANETPADRARLFRALSTLHSEKEFSIIGPKNERRQSQPQSLDDRLVVPSRRQILIRYP